MSVSEKLKEILERSSKEGYDPSTPMFRSLTPNEVEKFRESGRGALNGTTIMTAKLIFHPVVRLEIAYQMLSSLEESGEIQLSDEA